MNRYKEMQGQSSLQATQLGAPTEKMKEFAAMSEAPRLQAFSAYLALRYADAANTIDPALDSLRDADRHPAAGPANPAARARNAFVQERWAQHNENTSDNTRLRERIKQEKSKRNDVEGDSRRSTALCRKSLQMFPVKIFAARQVIDFVRCFSSGTLVAIC